MYGYFDESIIVIDGKKFVFLGFIVFQEKQTENIILREFSRTKSKLRNKKEIKFTNVRDSRIKKVVLNKIKNASNFIYSTFSQMSETDSTHNIINALINETLVEYFATHQNKILLLYDKVSYKINFKEFRNKFRNIKDFDFGNSISFEGIQYADWIVGEAAENLKQQKNRQ